MADTYTTNLNLTKPEPGAAEDTWGISLNSDLDTLDAIFSSSGTQVNLNPNQVNFADNKKAVFGAGSDLQIFHDGTNNFISSETGALVIRAQADDNDVVINSDNGSGGTVNYFRADGSAGSAILYNYGNQKLATTSTGIDVTGTVTADGLTVDGDAELGSANNLYLNNGGYDGSGTHAAIRWFSTGSAKRKAADIITAQADSFARSDLLFRTQSGTVNADPTEVMRITHDNRVGIGTSSPSTALDVTGTVTADGLVVDGNIQFTDSGSSNRNILYLDGSDNVVLATGTTAGFRGIDLYTNNNKSLSVAESGDISFYDDTGTSQALFWDASTERLGLGTTSPSAKLSIHAAVNNPAIEIVPTTDDNNADSAVLRLWGTRFGTANRYSEIRNVTDGSTANNELAFNTNGTERLRIASNGDISFYEDTGTTAKLFWDASAESLGIGGGTISSKLFVNTDTVGDSYFKGGADNSRFLDFSTFATASPNAGHKINATSINGQIAFATYDTEALRIDSSQRVGIGTSSPTEALHVEASGQKKILATNTDFVSNTTGSAFDIGFGATSGNTYTDLRALINGRSAWGDLVLQRGGGNVGIGTDSPSEQLHIYNTGHAKVEIEGGANEDASLMLTETGSTGFRFNYDGGDNKLFIGSGTAGTFNTKLTIERDSGNVGIGTTAPRTKLHISGLTGDDDPSLGSSTAPLFVSNTANSYGLNFGVSSSGDAWLQSQSNTAAIAYNLLLNPLGGNVGIGTSSPAAKLDVTGEALIQGRLQVTSSAPEILFSVPSGGLDSRIHNDGSGNFIFGTGTNSTTPTERMRIDSSGNVGIGTTDPTVASGNGLAIYDSVVPRVQLRNSTSGDASTDGAGIFMSGSDLGIENRESSNIIFYNNTEKMRIDSAGRVGIGTVSPSGKIDVNLSTGSLSATNSANFVLATLEATATSSTGAATYKTVANTTNSGLFATYLSTDNVSQLGSSRASSTQLVNTGGSSLRVGTLEATPLILGTNNSERMRIDSSGNLLVGTTSQYGQGLSLNANATAYFRKTGDAPLTLRRDSTDGSILNFYKDTSTVGSIATTSGAINLYGGSGTNGITVDSSGNLTATANVTAYSDERLKDNIQTLQGSKVLEMRGVSFTKDGKASSGVIAQEIEKVAPELVHTAKDEMGTKSVAYGNLVGYLIEAIKDQQQQIDELKARLDNDSSK